MSVGSWVGDDDEAGLFEGSRNVIGEVTRRKSTCDGHCASVRGEFQDSTLAVGTGGDDTDIGGVVDGGNDSGCKDDFLPVTRGVLSRRLFSRIVLKSEDRWDGTMFKAGCCATSSRFS